MLDNFKNQMRKVSDLSDDDCALFEEVLKFKTLGKQDLFVKESDVCQEIGFVHKGALRMYYLMDGKEINVHFFFENDCVTAFQSFLSGQPSRYFIEALEPCELITFTYQDLQKAYDQSHRWERIGRKLAEECYNHSTQRTESFLFLNGEQRYMQLLNSMPHIFQRIPLYHIASYLGVERESLSRLRRKITLI